jgi:flagellar protein FliO/FliZ
VKRFLHCAGLYLLAVLLLISTDVLAATPFAAPAPVAANPAASSALRVPLALLLVIALVLGAAWVLRRLTGTPTGGSQRMQVLSQLSLGTRERAVLVRVSGQDLLLGVAAGSVRTLHVFVAPVSEFPAAVSAAGVPVTGAKSDFGSSFREVLRRSLGK